MTYTESIVVGVVSGILTSVFIYFVVSAFRNVIIPWYQTLIYRGALVSGEWSCKNITATQDVSFSLKQKAHKLTGVATVVSKDPDDTLEPIRTFTVSGEIRDRILTMSLQHTNKKRLGASVYLLEFVGDGRTLSGFIAAYNTTTSEIGGTQVTLTRDSES